MARRFKASRFIGCGALFFTLAAACTLVAADAPGDKTACSCQKRAATLSTLCKPSRILIFFPWVNAACPVSNEQTVACSRCDDSACCDDAALAAENTANDLPPAAQAQAREILNLIETLGPSVLEGSLFEAPCAGDRLVRQQYVFELCAPAPPATADNDAADYGDEARDLFGQVSDFQIELIGCEESCEPCSQGQCRELHRTMRQVVARRGPACVSEGSVCRGPCATGEPPCSACPTSSACAAPIGAPGNATANACGQGGCGQNTCNQNACAASNRHPCTDDSTACGQQACQSGQRTCHQNTCAANPCLCQGANCYPPQDATFPVTTAPVALPFPPCANAYPPHDAGYPAPVVASPMYPPLPGVIAQAPCPRCLAGQAPVAWPVPPAPPGPVFMPVALEGGEPDPCADHTTTLRTAASRLDDVADMLEEAGEYHSADSLRAQADQLRRAVREQAEATQAQFTLEQPCAEDAERAAALRQRIRESLEAMRASDRRH